jgi:VCBS repeat-containing protein
VLENDDEADAGDTLTALLVDGPHHGTLTLADDGGFTYSPDTDYVGSDSFTYRASDGTDESNLATVSIEITDDDNAPVADDQSVSTEENTPLDITLTGSDDEDGPGSLTFFLASLPDNGGLTAAGPGLPDLTYVPDDGFTGNDSFTFVIMDTTGALSNTATITIEVNASPPPP